MKLFNTLLLIFVVSVLAGCQSTHETPSAPLANNSYQHFTHVAKGQLQQEFKTVNFTGKRVLTNDLALKQALINRPVTADMQLMLAFASTHENSISPRVNFIPVRGPKADDPITYTERQANSQTEHLLMPNSSADSSHSYLNRTVAILGPKQSMP